MVKLIDVIIGFSKNKERVEVKNLALEEIIDLFEELLNIYLQDKNSSTLREEITTKISGYHHLKRKLGYDGFKEINDERVYCEVKPRNISKNSEAKFPKKHDGGGNFTDYTFSRFEKDKKANLTMLISGFVDGKIIFIIEFRFNCQVFLQNFEKKLKKKFPKGDKKGEYLRSASFTFKNYKNCNNIKLLYLKKKSLEENQKYFQKNFFEFLKSFESI